MSTLVHSLSDMVSPKPTALLPVVRDPHRSFAFLFRWTVLIHKAWSPPIRSQADGCEEIEVVGLSAVLARAGVRVTIVSVNADHADHIVTLMQGTMIQADKAIEHCSQEVYDVIVVPGGPGAKILGASTTLTELLLKQKTAGRLYGAICAGSVDVLYRNALMTGPMTSYPQLKDQLGDLFVDEAVVVTGNCVTSQSPGTVIPMALKLVELLRGEKTARDLAKQLSA